MTFEIAQTDAAFQNAYHENVEERLAYGDTRLTPPEFYKVWLDRIKFEKNLENEK